MKKKRLPGTGLDDVIMPTTQNYYNRLHDKIMARIEDAEMEVPAQSAKGFTKSDKVIRDQVRVWMLTRNS